MPIPECTRIYTESIPVQFHTGLGDNDLRLSLATPSLMQPLIHAHPKTNFVLLHASYPFTREAGYLVSVYPNVYLDFGEVRIKNGAAS
jgi:predicted TIM-barrel fold metal-dependent hydrolase